jgi:predicted DNA-binding transcriptional regulator AlpA
VAKHPPDDPTEMLTVEQAAAVIGVKTSTLYQWCSRPGPNPPPPFYRIGSGRRCMIRFARVDVNNYLASRRVEPAV